MNFTNELNNYINHIGCTSKELVEASGLSHTVISRYRNGERTPKVKTPQYDKLVDGLTKLCTEKNINLSKEIIYNSLADSLGDLPMDADIKNIVKKFNDLVASLEINLADFSRTVNLDSSLIYKICKGLVAPTRAKEFISQICNYIVNKYESQNSKRIVSALINCNIQDLNNQSAYQKKLEEWFNEEYSKTNYNTISNFLNQLDTFDLNQYIKTIHFDTMKIPNLPFYRVANKTYYGLDEMKNGELDFFKATVFSKSNEPVFMCSDMPIEDMAKDINFGKKWMFAIAMTLKKGLHLNIIHNINRSFNEMMLGLEGWIPIYMTGQISPYYFKNFKDNVYSHLNYVSGSVALNGDCINNHHNDGKYYLTKDKQEVEYYKKKSKFLLKIAEPLMKIYRKSEQDAFFEFLISVSKTKGEYRRILSSLPIHTISEELLLKILHANKVSKNRICEIILHIKEEKEMMKNIISENKFTDEFEKLSEDEFNTSPALLFLANSFYENEITYTYEEYLEHLELTKKYTECNNNYHIKEKSNCAFRNIQILICKNDFVIISKNTNPTIHFVIQHPKLRNAIEEFIPPVIE